MIKFIFVFLSANKKTTGDIQQTGLEEILSKLENLNEKVVNYKCDFLLSGSFSVFQFLFHRNIRYYNTRIEANIE